MTKTTVNRIVNGIYATVAVGASVMIYVCLNHGNWIGAIAFGFVVYWATENLYG